MGGREVEEEEGRGEGKGICVWLGFLHRELDIWGNVFHFVESGICIFSSGFGLEIGIIIHQSGIIHPGNFFSFSFLIVFFSITSREILGIMTYQSVIRPPLGAQGELTDENVGILGMSIILPPLSPFLPSRHNRTSRRRRRRACPSHLSLNLTLSINMSLDLYIKIATAGLHRNPFQAA